VSGLAEDAAGARLSCVGRERSNARSTKNSAAAAVADCVGTDGFD